MKWTKQGCFYSLEQADHCRKSHTQLPVVDTRAGDNCWRIYYSSRNSGGHSLPYFIDIEAGNPENIIREQNEPLLELGKPGCFDEHGVMPTAIIDCDDKKYLYYIGWSLKQSVPYQNAIGLAISEDGGESYKRFSEGPLIAQNHIDPIFTGTFHVLRIGTQWHGYYMSCTQWRSFDEGVEPRYLLKHAYSSDGIHWQRNNHIAIDYLNEKEGGIVAASVLTHGEGYRMWYCHRNDHDYRFNSDNSYRIGFARSDDAINWRRDDASAGINISNTGWDSEMICYPTVVKYDNMLFMFYNGNGFGQSGIGYACCELTPCD